MADTYVSAGTGGSDAALRAGLPTVTANYGQTLTAYVNRYIEENLRPATRWMVPGSFIQGTIIEGTDLIRHIAYGDLDVQDSMITIEGEPPEVEDLIIGYDEYTAAQRGRLVGINDVSLKMSPHELLGVAAERIGDDAVRTVDRSIATAVLAGTGITLALTGAAVTAADEPKPRVLLNSESICRSKPQGN